MIPCWQGQAHTHTHTDMELALKSRDAYVSEPIAVTQHLCS